MKKPEEILKEARERKGLTQTEIGNDIGIGLRMYQKIEAGQFPKYKTEQIKKIDQILNTNLYELVYEQDVPHGTNTVSDPGIPYITQRRNLKNGSTKNFTPVFNTKASAGTAVLFNDRTELVIDYVDIPFIGKSDGVIEIVGYSMNPTYVNGTRIAVRKLEDKELIYPGECYYVIDANYDGRVKRLFKSEKSDHIILRSDNKEFPDVEFHWDKILAVCKILCRIIKN